MRRFRSRRPPYAVRAGSRHGWRLAVALGLLVLFGLYEMRHQFSPPSTVQGRAIIGDGDSLTIGGVRIRLAGIDAPEIGQQCRVESRSYDCGRRARDELRRLTADRPVSCVGRKTDQYGRLLAECKAGGRRLNAVLVESGWAVSYGGYRSEEEDARTRGSGLWAGEFDRPRTWRVNHGGLAEDEIYAGIFDWLLSLVGLQSKQEQPQPKGEAIDL